MNIDWALLIGFAGTLFAVANPFGNLPIFISFTASDRPGVQRFLAVMISVTVFLLILLFLFVGQGILGVFGISLPAFRIAGGIVILTIGLGMIHGQQTRSVQERIEKAEADDFAEAKHQLGKVMIPLGVPILVGPGSISAAILYANEVQTNTMFGALVVVLALFSILMMIVLLSASFIKRAIGEVGLDIFTRIMGLILAAIAIQFILSGLGDATVNFMNPDLYPSDST